MLLLFLPFFYLKLIFKPEINHSVKNGLDHHFYGKLKAGLRAFDSLNSPVSACFALLPEFFLRSSYVVDYRLSHQNVKLDFIFKMHLVSQPLQRLTATQITKSSYRVFLDSHLNANFVNHNKVGEKTL